MKDTSHFEPPIHWNDHEDIALKLYERFGDEFNEGKIYRIRKKIPPVFNEGERSQFDIDGITVRGWRFNHSGEKKILIVHGFESSVINFDRYVRPLILKGYEVLAFDAPAHGRSGGKRITAPLYKRTILHIEEQYGPLDAIIAHSLGGLAASLALEEIKGNENRKLVLIAPATETRSAIDSFFRFLHLGEAVREEFEKIIHRTGGVSSDWYSIRRAMHQIRSQVLWFHDESDDTTPIADIYKVQEENHDHVRFVITQGLGHRRIYRDNKVSRAILDFL